MTAKDIIKIMWLGNSHNKLRFKNTYFFENESDFLVVTNAGYVIDYEIKISKSDFKKDFVKRRHKYLVNKTVSKIANRFYFVVPSTLDIGIKDIPSYAGLIKVGEFGRKTKVKSAPLLHKKKHNLTKLYKKAYYEYERSVLMQFGIKA